MKARAPGKAARLLSVMALILLSSARATAEESEPPLPQWMETADFAAGGPAAPAATNDVLLNNLTLGRGAGSSQDFEGNSIYDSQAADDFCIPGAVGYWDVTQVEVLGGYNNPSGGTYKVDQARVQFYNDDGTGVPTTEVYVAQVTAGNATSGNLQLVLTTPARLAGFDCYWLSVRGIQPGGTSNHSLTWLWADRHQANTGLTHSAYRMLVDNQHACYNAWRARVAVCQRGLDPDLAFRLSGTPSTSHLTPTITSMLPSAGLDEDVALGLTGLNFAAGATISWTVSGVTTVFTPTVLGANALTATIPADKVTPEGETAQVQVKNPGSCVGICHSNIVTFAFEQYYPLYLPIVGR